MMRALRMFLRASAQCVGIPARLPLLRHDIHILGRVPHETRPRLARIGQSNR